MEYIYTMPGSFMEDKDVPTRWRLYGYLNSFFINGKPVYASNDYLATQLEVSDRSIQNAIKELEGLGLVHCTRTKTSRIINPTKRRTSRGETEQHTGVKPVSPPTKENDIKGRSQFHPNSEINSESRLIKIKKIKWEREKKVLTDLKAKNFDSYVPVIKTLVYEWHQNELKIKNELQKFANYWLEPDPNGKPKIDLQNTFEINGRIARWFGSPYCFGKKPDTAEVAYKARSEYGGSTLGDIIKSYKINN